MKEPEKIDIPIDEILDIVENIIPDTEPKTVAGKILRWIDKILKFKKATGIKIKK